MMLFAACLAGIPLLGTWGSLQWAPKVGDRSGCRLPADGGPYHAKEWTQIASASGAVIGTMIAALMGGWLGRRITYALLCIGSCRLAHLYVSSERRLRHQVAASRSSSPAESRPRSTAGSRFTCRNSFRRGFARPPRALPTTLVACSPRSARCKRRLSRPTFPRALRRIASRSRPSPRPERPCRSSILLGLVIIWFGPETKGQPLPE